MLYAASTEATSRVLSHAQRKKLQNQGRCQKCHQSGHWTYECKNARVYMARPSRTKQLKHRSLNRRLRPSAPAPEYKPSSYLARGVKRKRDDDKKKKKKKSKKGRKRKGSDSDSGSDSEEEDMPEEWADLPYEQQMRNVKIRAFTLMFVGTALVLIFSDPMVGVLSALGNKMDIKPFYVSFVLAPLASNASELLASYNYALKKTSKTITISFSALEGAAIMNNTFCLGIFLALVFFKQLDWLFAAETISILAVEAVMFFVARKRLHTICDAFIVLSLYPISLVLVAVLENVAKLN